MNSAESRRTMKGALDRLALMLMPREEVPTDYGELVPWHLLRYGHSSAVRERLNTQVEMSKLSPSHANKHLVALRGVVKEAWRHSLISADVRDRVTAIENIKSERLPAGRDIEAQEVADLLAMCDDDTPIGIRDCAIIAALHSTGGRRAEIADMIIENYQRGRRAVKFTGKGRKERENYFHPVAAAYVNRWLALVNEKRGPMFRPVDKHGHIHAGRLSARSVGRIVDGRRRKAGLTPLTTHDWRRTFIGDFLQAGGDLAQAQALAGHKSPVTTAQYDRRPGDLRRAVVDTFTLPEPGTSHVRQGNAGD
jgi:site-specific recombinase XerD